MSETNAFYNSLKALAIEIDTLRSDREAHERLKYKSQCQAECLDAFDIKLTQAEAENARLKAEVERLRKAGDWMCGLLRFDFVTKEWNAAKEGKPSV